jgi:periplasmic divalent cation tolerance protein
MTDATLVLVTAPSADKAAELARALVEEGLAACGNVLPHLRSIYRWEGKVQDEPEALLLLKTQASHFEALRQRVLSLHPYQCPEIIRVEIAQGHLPYLAWIAQSVTAAAG